MHKVQSVLFKKTAWTEAKARDWLKKHNYESEGKIHTTTEHLRFRQKDPSEFKKTGYYTVNLPNNVELVIGDRKPKKQNVHKGGDSRGSEEEKS
jgi:hypothetical protein